MIRQMCANESLFIRPRTSFVQKERVIVRRVANIRAVNEFEGA